jgi:DNA polymerase elongation subunit (family B)
MLQKHNTNKIIFLNIETAPQHAKFEDLSPSFKSSFLNRFRAELNGVDVGLSDEKTLELFTGSLERIYQEKAGLTSEFGKIACISFLVITDADKCECQSLSIADSDEKKLIQTFLDKAVSIRDWPKIDADKKKSVCSYSGFGFTWPYIAHRCLLNFIPIPPMFDYSEGKPWEQEHLISLMNVWNYNRSSSYTSLSTLAESFGVEHHDFPSQVAGWYHASDFESLKEYSKQRTITLATVYLRIKGITNNLIKTK